MEVWQSRIGTSALTCASFGRLQLCGMRAPRQSVRLRMLQLLAEWHWLQKVCFLLLLCLNLMLELCAGDWGDKDSVGSGDDAIAMAEVRL